MLDTAPDVYQNAVAKGCRVCESEHILFTSPYWTAHYAKDIVKAPWPEAESVIAQDGLSSTMYAELVLGSKFQLGEPAIAQSPRASRIYSEAVIGGQWEPGEQAISTDALESVMYAILIGGKWEPGENIIAQSPAMAVIYSTTVLRERFYEAEPLLATSQESAKYTAHWFNEPTVTKDQVNEHAWNDSGVKGYFAPARLFMRKGSVLDAMLDIQTETVL